MSDDRIKELMAQTPLPESLSIYTAFKQFENELRSEIYHLKGENVKLHDIAGAYSLQIACKQEQCDQLAHENIDLERQLDASQALLAEARAENERLNLENRQMLQGMKWDNQIRAEARQEAAREIICKHIEFFLIDSHDRGCLIRSICKSFKLEG